MPSDIEPELIERMVALVRRLAKDVHMPFLNDEGIGMREAASEAYSIACKLLRQIDPDLIEARRIVADRLDDLQVGCGYLSDILNGNEDDSPSVINALAGIKRGRELERGQ